MRQCPKTILLRGKSILQKHQYMGYVYVNHCAHSQMKPQSHKSKLSNKLSGGLCSPTTYHVICGEDLRLDGRELVAMGENHFTVLNNRMYSRIICAITYN